MITVRLYKSIEEILLPIKESQGRNSGAERYG